jgi:hypothetical protein
MGWFGGKSKSKQSQQALEKMQQKISLNEQTQKNTYDLTHCEMNEVPSGTYFDTDLHLKTGLNLSNNNLKSLKNGGSYDQLQAIHTLNLASNLFKTLDHDLFPFLCNLSVLDLSNNKITALPENFGCVTTLQTLNLERNEITTLPTSIGHCKFLCELNLKQNPVEKLPTSLGLIGITLEVFELDESDHLDSGVRERLGDTQQILKFLAEKGNHVYNTKVSVHNNKISVMKSSLYPNSAQKSESDTDLEKYLLEQHAQADTAANLALKAINDLDEQARIQAMQAHEESEKVISETMKVLDLDDENSKKLVLSMAEDRSRYLQEATNIMEHEEKQANNLILRILKEQEFQIPSILDRIERDENILRENLRKTLDEGISMDEIIQKDLMENAEMARFLKSHMNDQKKMVSQTMKTIEMDEEFISENVKLSNKINQENAEILAKQIAEDEDLLKNMFMSALKARDGEILQIEADISNIERQLVRMTMIDINERDLIIKDVMSSERKELTNLLEILHNQMMDREKMIATTVDNIEQSERDERVDFWLVRYKQVLQEKPPELVHLESRLSQVVRDVLLTADCEIYIGLFARHSILEENDLRYLTGARLESMGIWSVGEQNRILASITKYVAPMMVDTGVEVPVAPPGDSPRGPLYPELEPSDKESGGKSIDGRNSQNKTINITNFNENSTSIKGPIEVPTAPSQIFQTERECVICLDETPDTIFIPCGHVISCADCAAAVSECPVCRTEISKKLPLSMKL